MMALAALHWPELPLMELAPETRQLAKYSPTSTPILDVLRSVNSRGRSQLGSGDYFFLSSIVIVALIALPWFRLAAASISPVLNWWSIAIAVFVVPALALAAAVAVHEAGHLLAAALGGFRVVSTPEADAARKLYGVQRLELGIIKLETPESGDLSRRLLLVVIGGPVASLSASLIAELVAAQAGPRAIYALALHAFAAMSMIVGVAELLPDSGYGVFSDGARILMLLRKDAAGRRWLSNMLLVRALMQGQHPRGWREETITAATAIDDDSRDAVVARWLGYLWAVERQNITASTRFLEELLAAPDAAIASLRDRLCLEAAVFQAWFREDAEKALYWSEQIGRGKLAPHQRARLEIALLWCGGNLFDAWEKLEGYLAQLRQMPASPARNLVEQSALEWKGQMESRMLTRAWRTMYDRSQDGVRDRVIG